MKSKIIVIRSKDRISGTRTNFTLNPLPLNIKILTVVPLEVSIPKIANITDMSIIIDGSAVSIPTGSYSDLELADFLQNALNAIGSGWVVSYNGKFTITGSGSFTSVFPPDNPFSFPENFTGAVLTSTDFVSIVPGLVKISTSLVKGIDSGEISPDTNSFLFAPYCGERTTYRTFEDTTISNVFSQVLQFELEFEAIEDWWMKIKINFN